MRPMMIKSLAYAINLGKDATMKRLLYALSVILPVSIICNMSTAEAQRKNTTDHDVKPAMMDTSNDAWGNPAKTKGAMKEKIGMKDGCKCSAEQKSADCNCMKGKMQKKLNKNYEEKIKDINEDYEKAVRKINKSSFNKDQKDLLNAQAKDNRDFMMKTAQEKKELRMQQMQDRQKLNMKQMMKDNENNKKAVKKVNGIL